MTKPSHARVAVLLPTATLLPLAAAALLSGCSGSEARTSCLPTGQKGTVLRTRSVHDGNARDEAVSVAIRVKGGETVSCVGGHANAALSAGDVVDGRSLHAYRTE